MISSALPLLAGDYWQWLKLKFTDFYWSEERTLRLPVCCHWATPSIFQFHVAGNVTVGHNNVLLRVWDQHTSISPSHHAQFHYKGAKTRYTQRCTQRNNHICCRVFAVRHLNLHYSWKVEIQLQKCLISLPVKKERKEKKKRQLFDDCTDDYRLD